MLEGKLISKRFIVELSDGSSTTIVATQVFVEAVYPGKWLFDSEIITPAEDIRPEIVVTSLVVSEVHAPYSMVEADLSSVTLPVGATLTVTCEVRMGATLVPVNEAFRMPLISTDGRERVILVRFVDGVAVFSPVMNDSRIYYVNEEMVNRELPEEAKMKFKGFKVYAVE